VHPAPAIAVIVAEQAPSIEDTPPRALPAGAVGHYSGEISINYDVKATVAPPILGGSCVYIDAITITMAHSAALRVADTHAAGSCRYAAIMDHEQAHAEIDRRLLRKFAQRIEDGLRLAYATPPDFTAGPFPTGEGQGRAALFGPGVVAVVDNLAADMFRQRQHEQAQLDTPASYQAMTGLCRN
jgi:hypothetical protein